MKQKTLFDEENRLELLSQLGDPLEILNRVIKWEKFRSVLNQGCRKEDTGKGGRPSYDGRPPATKREKRSLRSATRSSRRCSVRPPASYARLN